MELFQFPCSCPVCWRHIGVISLRSAGDHMESIIESQLAPGYCVIMGYSWTEQAPFGVLTMRRMLCHIEINGNALKMDNPFSKSSLSSYSYHIFYCKIHYKFSRMTATDYCGCHTRSLKDHGSNLVHCDRFSSSKMQTSRRWSHPSFSSQNTLSFLLIGI